MYKYTRTFYNKQVSRSTARTSLNNVFSVWT